MVNFNSTIKIKFGKCPDCSEDEPEKCLFAKRCLFHYKKHRAAISKGKPENKRKAATKSINGAFIANQALTMPKFSEESGLPLPLHSIMLRKCCCAHILPKREGFGGFPSVALHPQNFIFLTLDEHADFDNKGEAHILKMKSLPIMRERVAKMIPDMPQSEVNKIPHYFL